MNGHQTELTQFIEEHVHSCVSTYHVYVEVFIASITLALCIGILVLGKCPLLIHRKEETSATVQPTTVAWRGVAVVGALIWCICYHAEYCSNIIKHVCSSLSVV